MKTSASHRPQRRDRLSHSPHATSHTARRPRTAARPLLAQHDSPPHSQHPTPHIPHSHAPHTAARPLRDQGHPTPCRIIVGPPHIWLSDPAYSSPLRVPTFAIPCARFRHVCWCRRCDPCGSHVHEVAMPRVRLQSDLQQGKLGPSQGVQLGIRSRMSLGFAEAPHGAGPPHRARGGAWRGRH